MTEDKIATSMSEEGAEDFAAMLAAHETASSRLQPGQKVTGTVIAITGDSVFVDVGIKVDGIIDRKDILDAEGNESVKPGDSLEAWVTGVSSQEIRLSRSMSGSGVAALEEARDAAVPVDGRVTAVCKGGYTVDVLGKSAFCPGSQIGVAATEDATALVGHSMQFLLSGLKTGAEMLWFRTVPLLNANAPNNLTHCLKASSPAIPLRARSRVLQHLAHLWNLRLLLKA